MANRSGIPALLAALAERNYRTFTIGNVISHNGTWAQRAAVMWLTWQLTHSGTWLGLMTTADLLPVVFLGPLGGAMADRVNILKMMKITQVMSSVQSALLAGLTMAGFMTPELMFALVLVNGMVLSFNQPARLALVPHLISRENLSAGIGINSMIFNSARATGPALGGALIQFYGAGWAFAFNAVSYIWFVGSLYLLRLDNPRSTKAPTRIGEVPREIAEGVRYALGHPGIGRALIILCAVSICGRPYMELLSGFADEVFGRGAEGYSLMYSATGVGAMLGGFWLAQRGRVTGLTAHVVLAVLILGAGLIGFTATTNFYIALACLLVTGFALIAIGAGEQMLIQTAVDSAVRGRVMSLYGLIGRGAPALGAMSMGALAEVYGFRIPVFGGAVVLIGLWIWAMTRRSRMAAAMEPEEEA